MKVTTGCLYLISDAFFEKAQDPYLKINYKTTKRPHYVALRDEKTNLFWMVPCSSKIEKFERLIQQKQHQHKPTDTIKIVKIFNKKEVLLFQDMFPVSEKYIVEQYMKGERPVRITDPKLIRALEQNARKVIKLIHEGVCFTPTQPNAQKIEKMMIEELRQAAKITDGRLPVSPIKPTDRPSVLADLHSKQQEIARQGKDIPAKDVRKKDDPAL